jgi:hypothetical protein
MDAIGLICAAAGGAAQVCGLTLALVEIAYVGICSPS